MRKLHKINNERKRRKEIISQSNDSSSNNNHKNNNINVLKRSAVGCDCQWLSVTFYRGLWGDKTGLNKISLLLATLRGSLLCERCLNSECHFCTLSRRTATKGHGSTSAYDDFLQPRTELQFASVTAATERTVTLSFRCKVCLPSLYNVTSSCILLISRWCFRSVMRS